MDFTSQTKSESNAASSTGLHAIDDSSAESDCAKACSKTIGRMFNELALLI